MLGFHFGLYSDRVAQSLLNYIDILILITSAICHDLDHPGSGIYLVLFEFQKTYMLGFHLGLYSDRVARSLLDYIDILILITSAICHDLDHPGSGIYLVLFEFQKTYMLGFHLGLYSDRVAQSLLDYIDILILITSAICHDLDHPGYNNAYQVFCYLSLVVRKPVFGFCDQVRHKLGCT